MRRDLTKSSQEAEAAIPHPLLDRLLHEPHIRLVTLGESVRVICFRGHDGFTARVRHGDTAAL